MDSRVRGAQGLTVSSWTEGAAVTTTSRAITYIGECKAWRYGEDEQGVKSQEGRIWREMEVLAHLQAIREDRLSLHSTPITSAVTVKVKERGIGQRTRVYYT